METSRVSRVTSDRYVYAFFPHNSYTFTNVVATVAFYFGTFTVRVSDFANNFQFRSIVDQWDWEKIITKEERNLETLKETVRTVYKVLRKTEKYMSIHYDYIEEILPHDIFFVTTSELAEMFPDYSPKEREYYIAKAKGAVCIMQIGETLENGKPHDGRAPDYDDWALNADIVVYYPVLDIALELSSMGIRVDKKALLDQLQKAGCPERAELPYHKAVIDGELPLTIGGGIGQSRICMFFLRKAHIGEVQCSLWSDEVMKIAEENGLQLL